MYTKNTKSALKRQQKNLKAKKNTQKSRQNRNFCVNFKVQPRVPPPAGTSTPFGTSTPGSTTIHRSPTTSRNTTIHRNPTTPGNTTTPGITCTSAILQSPIHIRGFQDQSFLHE